uniref:Uncharacterized protein n=1 Tax=Chromera velia CCMP2878 TaxID=1169474 RepID=A0A0G4IFJ9_9ALVE|eukprot:Cvel_13936.t1-p1 / transcript=Cvel_13936.t1 / gene=Cvel_13936 / organism=Chromera_velia_CCMP2878 / gene_product=hypothetical protein / transcript_product=hypothetical protein / location=Cvel_scaffold972:45834-50038(-) / protein_length=434 / sequence_SO=supercontig / SO=protein_coding / is_pseudo=false
MEKSLRQGKAQGAEEKEKRKGNDEERNSLLAPLTKIFYIARHGERIDHVDPAWRYTEGNSIEDAYLSERGFRQARDLGKYLSNEGITHVYSSPFLRCVQTAQTAAMFINQRAREGETTGMERPKDGRIHDKRGFDTTSSASSYRNPRLSSGIRQSTLGTGGRKEMRPDLMPPSFARPLPSSHPDSGDQEKRNRKRPVLVRLEPCLSEWLNRSWFPREDPFRFLLSPTDLASSQGYSLVDTDYQPLGGRAPVFVERAEDLRERARQVVRQLSGVHRPGDRVLLVSHGAFIEALYLAFTQRRLAGGVGYCSIVRIEMRFVEVVPPRRSLKEIVFEHFGGMAARSADISKGDVKGQWLRHDHDERDGAGAGEDEDREANGGGRGEGDGGDLLMRRLQMVHLEDRGWIRGRWVADCPAAAADDSFLSEAELSSRERYR